MLVDVSSLYKEWPVIVAEQDVLKDVLDRNDIVARRENGFLVMNLPPPQKPEQQLTFRARQEYREKVKLQTERVIKRSFRRRKLVSDQGIPYE